MKNTILVLISILIIGCATLIMISDSSNYVAEKLLYQATRTYERITANPDVAPPAMIASVENKLKEIMQKYPGSKTAKLAHFNLAELYLINEKYNQAHSISDEIIETYTQDRAMLSRAHFFKGAVYEKQNLWSKALEEYRILRDEYTETHFGLTVPLYIGNYYRAKKNDEQANQAYLEAVLWYKKLETKNRAKPLGYRAANLLVQAHLNLKQYEQAGKTIEDIVNNYPKAAIMLQQLPKMELIFVKKLNNPEKAIKIYERIRQKTDQPELIKFIDGRIKALTFD